MELVDFGSEEVSGLHLLRLDMEAIYAKTTSPIHIDEFDITDPEDVEDLKKLLFSTYEGDALNNLPKCACPKNPITGRFNLGVVCSRCNHEVRSGADVDIDTQVWVRANERQYKFIVPRWMYLLENRYSTKGVSFIRWFADPRYRIPKDNIILQNKLMKVQSLLGIGRGWVSFCDNLLAIVKGLNEAGLKKASNVYETQEVYSHLEEHIDIVFTRYLPLPSNIALIKEKTSTGTYGDTSISDVINGARTISELYAYDDCYDDDKYDSAMYAAMHNIAAGHTKFNKDELFSKQGAIRSAQISGRMDMSARAVITSITRPHDYRELEISWPMGIKLFEKQLCKYLYQTKKMSVTKAIMHLRYHYYIYDETIDEGLQTILSQGPALPRSDFKLTGYPCTLQRNPGLKSGSQQTLFITRVKQDPTDWTISLSGLILAAPNSDKPPVTVSAKSPAGWKRSVCNVLNCWETLKRIYHTPSLGERCRKTETSDTMTYDDSKSTGMKNG